MLYLRIFVLKQGKPIGYLEEKTFNRVCFRYLKNIKPLLYIPGLEEKINYCDTGLFLVFKNMFPENNQIEILKTQHSIGSNIELLLYLEDIHGSYTFLNEEEYEKYIEPASNIYHYSKVLNSVLENHYTFPNILEHTLNIDPKKLHPENIVNNKVIGLSGFQYKFSIIKDDDKKSLFIDEEKTSEYFMKPYSKYSTTYTPNDKERHYIPYLLINEHLFMTIARDLGFPVPYNAIIKDGEDYHYIIKRFDRYKDEKFDHEEFATLLGYDSDTKYDATLIEVLEKASEYISKDDLRQLLLFFFFSTIISHGDLHSKNISLIHASNSIEEQTKYLAPYYDISTTFIYRGLKQKDVGLKILNKKSKIKKNDFLKIAKKFDIDEIKFENDMKKIVEFFLNKFHNYIHLLPSDIQDLPFYSGHYYTRKPLKSILEKYYIERKKYIKKYIDATWVEEKYGSIFD